jgi:PadR family transcriptional regulator, regulatory protein AphA
MAKRAPGGARTDLTPTSFALLGLLAIKPWTTYELAQQMDRTLSRFWPRARSKLYEEPKKLVAHGLARAREDSVGRRPRTT